MSKKTQNKTRLIAGCGMLTAAAAVLQFIEFSIPIIPSFIKLDFSDLPELIGAFAYGPLAGIGAVFSGVAGLIYNRRKTKKSALLGGTIGALCMAAVSFPSNLFIVYPFYYNFMPKEVVLQAYQTIMPSIGSIEESLLVFNLPFTLVKGLSVSEFLC